MVARDQTRQCEGALAERLLSACGWRRDRPPRAVVFVAHPDDETIGFGGHFRALPHLLIVHATDGAPRNLRDAQANGFATADEYAQARRRELRAAMGLAGVGEEALLCLGYADQGAAHRLVSLARSFAARLARQAPDVVFAHAYEGGHPDHDAVAFAARAAARLLDAHGYATPLLVEMPYYRSEGGGIARQRFAPADAPGTVIPLSQESQALKRRMLDCFVTQRETLKPFQPDEECFRVAAPCDFSAPANGGDVHYDRQDWGCSSAEFVARCRAALAELGLPPCL